MDVTVCSLLRGDRGFGRWSELSVEAIGRLHLAFLLLDETI